MSQQINLFNPIFLKQKKYFSAATIAQALGLILIGSVLLSAYSAVQSRSLSLQAVHVSEQLAATQQQLAKVNAQYAPRKKDQPLEDELNRLQAEQAALQQAMAKLQNDEFGNRKGYSNYLRAFARRILPGLWLTGFSIEGAGRAIGIQGRTLQPELVPAYIRRLGQEPIMQGISFAVLEMQVPKKDAAAKESESKGGPDAIKKIAAPDHIEFDLRSAGIEKANAQPSAAVAGTKAPSGAPSQPERSLAESAAQGAKAQIDSVMQSAKATALPATGSSGVKRE
jgi:cell division protein FtsB